MFADKEISEGEKVLVWGGTYVSKAEAEVAKKTKNGSSPLELITKALGSGE